MMANAKIKTSYTTLQSKSGATREYGYLFTDNTDPEELQLANGSDNTLIVPVGGKRYGASHLHPNPETGFMPMFSISDIYKLGDLAAAYNNNGNPKDYSKFVFTLTVKQGGGNQTFALKIDDWNKFLFFVNSYYSKSLAEKQSLANELQRQYTKVPKIYGTIGLLKALYNVMKSQNIDEVSIYMSNGDDLSKWSKLSYNAATNDIDESTYN